MLYLPSQQAMTNRRGYKDVLPVLTHESDRRDSSPSFTAEGLSSHVKPHPISAPEGRTGSWQLQMSAEEEEGVSEWTYIYIYFYVN